jgi:hypothetical protein
MDTIAQHLSGWRGRVAVPQSVPGLVTQRLMVMSYMDGLPLMQLREKIEHLPQWKKDKVRGGARGGRQRRPQEEVGMGWFRGGGVRWEPLVASAPIRSCICIVSYLTSLRQTPSDSVSQSRLQAFHHIACDMTWSALHLTSFTIAQPPCDSHHDAGSPLLHLSIPAGLTGYTGPACSYAVTGASMRHTLSYLARGRSPPLSLVNADLSLTPHPALLAGRPPHPVATV